MTLEQYNELSPYRDTAVMCANEGVYVGGADGLIPIYERIFQTNVKRTCSNCISDMLIRTAGALRRYDKENGII